MFEFWFHGLEDDEGRFTFTGTTTDFLEFCCQIALHYNDIIAGDFVRALMATKEEELSFLRITEWNFEYTWEVSDPNQKIALGDGQQLRYVEKKIVLKKLQFV